MVPIYWLSKFMNISKVATCSLPDDPEMVVCNPSTPGVEDWTQGGSDGEQLDASCAVFSTMDYAK